MMTMRATLAGAAISIAVTLATAPAPAQVKSAGDWDNKIVPLELFAQFPQIERPRMSPDGKWIAAKIRAQKRQVLAIIPINQPGVKPQIVGGDDDFSKDKTGERRVTEWRWLNDDILLIGIDTLDEFLGSVFDNVRYVAFNRATNKAVPLGWDKAFAGTSLLWSSSDGAPRILLERSNPENGTERLSRPEVVEIDAITGKETVVMHANPVVESWEVDRGGVVRMGEEYDADTGRMSVIYRSDAKAAMKTIFTGTIGRGDSPPVPGIMLKDSGKAYSVSAQDGFAALYEFDLATMKLGKKLFGVPGYDIGAPILSRDGARLDGVAMTTQRGQQIYFDPRLKEIQAVLEEAAGKGNVEILSGNAAREQIVFSVAELGQAPTIYVFDTRTGTTGRLAYYNEALKNARLNPVSVVHYPASDGKQIEAILTMPRHRAGQKNLPAIVLPHGGPWARDDADWDPFQWAQALAENGYVVIQPNYRGSTGYGTAWGKAADKAWGYRMQDDLNDAVTWLAAQGIADAKRVCMMGWSYGGYAASRAAQRDGDKYRCTISGAGVHDLPAMVAYDKNYLGNFRSKQAIGSAGDLADVSPALHASQYSTPILIIHGARDQRVPVAQSRGLVARLKAAGKVEGRDFVYVEQPLNTHNLQREEDRLQVLEEVKKFLDAHNPA